MHTGVLPQGAARVRRRVLPEKRTFFNIGMEKVLDPSKNVTTGTLRVI